MKKEVVFTICAKNYIGLAQVLERSIKKNHSGLLFYIFVADEFDNVRQLDLPENVVISKVVLKRYISSDKWDEMSFKYNLTEFCTSIKPFCFKYLFEMYGAEKVVYLDPDIFVFSSLSPVFDMLNKYKIILTPHITTFNKVYNGERSESGILNTGVFNLGFLGLGKSSEVAKMLNWWGERLRNKCYMDVLDSFFTDQKWMDFLPCFFDGETLLTSKNIGLNVAPWNFFEREVFLEKNEYYVRLRKQTQLSDNHPPIENDVLKVDKLIFMHFSGYDYNGLMNGEILQNNIQNLEKYNDFEPVCRVYGEFLNKEKETFKQYINLSYSYNTFNDGKQLITSFIRRIYRGLLEEGLVIVRPFSIQEGSFYGRLKRAKMLLMESGVNIDKVNKLTLEDASGKLSKINFIMRIFFKLIGLNKYILLLRLMRPYSRVENHIHLFDNKFSSRLK